MEMQVLVFEWIPRPWTWRELDDFSSPYAARLLGLGH